MQVDSMTVKQTRLEDNGVEHKDTPKEQGKRPGECITHWCLCGKAYHVYEVLMAEVGVILIPDSIAAEDIKESKEPNEQHEDKKAKTEANKTPTETAEPVDKKATKEADSKTAKATPAADPTEPLAEGKPTNVVEEGRIYFFYRCHCSCAGSIWQYAVQCSRLAYLLIACSLIITADEAPTPVQDAHGSNLTANCDLYQHTHSACMSSPLR